MNKSSTLWRFFPSFSTCIVYLFLAFYFLAVFDTDLHAILLHQRDVQEALDFIVIHLGVFHRLSIVWLSPVVYIAVPLIFLPLFSSLRWRLSDKWGRVGLRFLCVCDVFVICKKANKKMWEMIFHFVFPCDVDSKALALCVWRSEQ